jgi:nicotinamidase-related amidase
VKSNKLLLIVDVQNDFCAKSGKFDKIHEPIEPIKAAMPKLKLAIKKAREKGYNIIFTKSLQVFDDLPENMQERILKHNRKEEYLVPNSWGADFFDVKPEKGEVVIDKYRYDIFTNPEFEKYLKKNKIREILLCGFFMDICVDSAMRTAYQKGYYTTLLKDATASLFFEQEKMEEFMKKFYDTNIKTVEEEFTK